MAANVISSREISDEVWDRTEHDWAGKSFYYVTAIFILGKALGLDSKLEQLTREVREGGYKIINQMILIQHGKFKGKIMIEIEKKDLWDAQVFTYDVGTSCDTVLHLGGLSNLGKGIERLKERVVARRMRDPREIFYLYQPDMNNPKIIVFALT